MTEKQLADNIMKVHGESIWEDYANGNTASGDQMMDFYCFYFAGSQSPIDIYNQGLALRHWVSACGIDPETNQFVYYLSDHILNC